MQETVELIVKGKTLRGMYHRPEREGKFPTVILFHGFTGDKLEPHRIFLKLSRQLEKHGLAVVRFDFSGSGESDGDFAEMTFSSEVREAEEILRFVRNLPETAPEQIGILGLSMGGAIASILAGRNPTLVKALVLWSAAGLDTIAGVYHRKEENDQFLRNWNGDIDIGGLWLNSNFYNDLSGWNSYEEVSTYQGPVLILQGTGDQTVEPATAEKYQAALSGRAQLLYIKDADHTFNRHHWEEQVLSKTVAFLEKNFRST